MPAGETTTNRRTDIAKLAPLSSFHAPYDGLFPLRVPGVDVYRASRAAAEVTHAMQQAAVCIVAQGAKSVGNGGCSGNGAGSRFDLLGFASYGCASIAPGQVESRSDAQAQPGEPRHLAP